MSNRNREQMEWRRNKVQELAVKGYRQTEIVQILQINKSTICKDVSFLKEHARNTIRNHIEDRLPYEYNKCLQGLEEIIKESWIIADKAEDTKEKLQSLALIKESYSTKMDLLTNAGLLSDSVKWVEQTKERLSKRDDMEGFTETNNRTESTTAV